MMSETNNKTKLIMAFCGILAFSFTDIIILKQ